MSVCANSVWNGWPTCLLLLSRSSWASCRAAGKKKHPQHAQRVYAYLQGRCLDTHRVLGNYLVPMLAECGCLPHAQLAFDRLPQRNHCSWNCLIWGYIHNGQPEHALHLYHDMHESHLLPNSHTYVALLKACTVLLVGDAGRRIHRDIVTTGSQNDLFISNTLVDMYGKCGSLAEARYVFDELTIRDAVSWNALIAGYAEHGFAEEALSCYGQMQQHGIFPDAVTFVCSLKACASIESIKRGWKLCVEVTKLGLESNIFIGSTMIDMYVKCGLLFEARKVFDSLPFQNVVSWTAMIGGYAENGLGDDALDCFEQMQLEGISPNANTFVSSLKACGSTGSLERGLKIGRQIRAEVAEKGLDTELLVGNTLVDMFCRRGSMVEAREVFDKLFLRDNVSWNALLAGYAELGHGEDAMSCFNQMKLEGLCPDVVTLVCCLKACGSTGGFMSWQLCAEIVKMGLEKNLSIGCTMLDMYCKCGFILEALQVFEKLPARDAVSWNAMIVGYAEHGYVEEALECFKQMQLNGMFPDDITYVGGLKACGLMEAVDTGQGIHSEIIKRGFDRELYVSNTLVDMYAKCGLVPEAHKVFDQLPSRTVVSWAALISGYADQEFDADVLGLFEKMQAERVCADVVTFVRCLKSCGTMGALDIGREMHAESLKLGFEGDLSVGNTLVDMYVRCGILNEGWKIFNKLPIRDVVSWNAMIKGFGENHESSKAIQCFEKMQEQGVKPNAITFICLLVACSHASLVLEGREYFKMMDKFGIEPTLDHYLCIVDLFARSGCLYEAERFIEAMQCLPPKETLNAMLSACRFYGEIEVGLRCFQRLVKMNKGDAAPYLLMADIYTNAGQWMDAHKIEGIRKHAQAMKMPASASLELNKKFHEFFVRENQSYISSTMLKTLSPHMKNEGYVPYVDLVSVYTS